MNSDPDDPTFHEQFERYTLDPAVKKNSLTLLSGDRYELTTIGDISLGKQFVTIIRKDNTQSIFPFEAVCNVDVTVSDPES